METYFLHVEDSDPIGPLSVDEIRDKLAEESITGEDYLWHDEGTGWVKANILLPKLFGDKSAGSEIHFESITSNPYRVLGVAIDASEREKNKIVELAKKFAKAKKEIPADKLQVKDFSLSVPPKRSVEELQEAVSRIQQVEGKLKNAHMWFWEGNAVDKKAITTNTTKPIK